MENNISNSSQPTYFHRELDRKNKQISEMQTKINNLIDEKSTLQKTIYNLKTENYNLGILNENENKKTDFEHQNQINELFQVLNNLQNENYILKSQLNKKDKREQNYNNTISKQLNQAKREIDNLQVMNTIKDNILRELQDFINQLNQIIGDNNFELDFNNDNINTFKSNLYQIKQRIFSRLNNNIQNQNLELPNNYNNENNINYTEKENKINNSNNNINYSNNNINGSRQNFSYEKLPVNKDLSLYKRSISNYSNKTVSKHIKDCKCEGCRKKAMKDPLYLSQLFEFKSKAWIKKPTFHSVLRTPPRDMYDDEE